MAELKPRRVRSLPEKLGSIVLGFESIVAFLGGLVVYGVRALPDPVAPWWGIVGGVVVAALMILTAGLLRHRWAFALGWALQVVVAASAFVIPAMSVVAIVFGGMWAYATIGGARIESRAARTAASDGRPARDT